VYFYFVMGC